MAEDSVRRRLAATLADLCDALLSKLISVEPRLKDTVKLMEMAVRALDWFFGRPIFKTTDFVATAGIPRATATRILRVVRDEGMLRELRPPGGRRCSHFPNCGTPRRGVRRFEAHRCATSPFVDHIGAIMSHKRTCRA
jgi:hypothetical protein